MPGNVPLHENNIKKNKYYILILHIRILSQILNVSPALFYYMLIMYGQRMLGRGCSDGQARLRLHGSTMLNY